MFIISDAVREAYPGAQAGILALQGVTNPPEHAALAERKAALQAELRARYAGQERKDIAALEVIQAYTAYYRRFDKTYHVLAQIESITFKGREIPNVAALVEAMFMAEVKNLLLTAGHDLDSLRLPVCMDVSDGSQTYRLRRGIEQTLKTGDMFMADGEGVISSILHGPDERTQIVPGTQRALFTVYAPPGIPTWMLRAHLEDIRDNVQLVSPGAQTVLMEVYGTGEG